MSHVKNGWRQTPGPGFAAALPYRYGGGKAKPAGSKCYRHMINIGGEAYPAVTNPPLTLTSRFKFWRSPFHYPSSGFKGGSCFAVP
jgi:hypothetical protein